MYLKIDPQIHWDIRIFVGQKGVFQQPVKRSVGVYGCLRWVTAGFFNAGSRHHINTEPVNIVIKSPRATYIRPFAVNADVICAAINSG